MHKRNEFLMVASLVSLLAFPLAASATTLTASCTGAPTTTNITWTATASGGVSPVAFLWSNGSTSTTQTVAVAPGSYSMTLQITDASSTVATTTCSATVAAPVPQGPSLAEQIASLTNQINALKLQLAQLLIQQANSNLGTATSTPTGCFNFGHDIGEGDQGNDVEDLQKTLASDPSIFPASLVTGYFGPLTREAVKKFQEKHGISGTGYFGPRSRAFFENQCSSGDSNHDGIPDSLESNDGEHNSSNDGSPATSTINNEHGSGSSQVGGEHSSDSTRVNGNHGSDN